MPASVFLGFRKRTVGKPGADTSHAIGARTGWRQPGRGLSRVHLQRVLDIPGIGAPDCGRFASLRTLRPAIISHGAHVQYLISSHESSYVNVTRPPRARPLQSKRIEL